MSSSGAASSAAETSPPSSRKRTRALSACQVTNAYSKLVRDFDVLERSCRSIEGDLQTVAQQLQQAPPRRPFVGIADFVRLRLELLRRLVDTSAGDIMLFGPEIGLVEEMGICPNDITNLRSLHSDIVQMLAVVNDAELNMSKAKLQRRLKAAGEIEATCQRMVVIARWAMTPLADAAAGASAAPP